MMNAAAPDGTPPRRINFLRKKTVICPAVPRRGPEAGSPRKDDSDGFHDSGVNARSCAFLQSRFFLMSLSELSFMIFGGSRFLFK
jgi:hypothetical protein